MKLSKEEIVFEVIKERRSVRAYKEQNVPKEMLTKILEAGRWAPTPSNVQSWRFIVIQESRQLKSLKALSPGFPRQAQVAIAVCSDQRDMQIFEGPWPPILAAEEAAVAVQNMMLMAHSLSVGSCPVVSFSKVGIRELLKLPNYIYPIFLVTLGYSDDRPVPPPRKPLSQITFWERYEEAI